MQQFFLDLCRIGEHEARFALIFDLGAVRRVVHLEHELGAGGDAAGVLFGPNFSGRAGDEGGDGVNERIFAALFILAGRQIKQDHVVDDGGIARAAFGAANPDVFFDAGIDYEILIGDDARGRNLVGFGHFDDEVGTGNTPRYVGVELWRLGQIGGIAFGHAVIDPGKDGLLIGIGQAAIVAEFAELGVGVPGRHAFVLDDFTDRVGPGGGGLVGS